MRWPWQRAERREAGGSYTGAIVAAIEAQAASQVADAGATAAVEAAAGALSRALAGAEIDGPSWAQETVNPVWLSQVGRSLIREGASLSTIDMTGDGRVDLTPAAFWNFETLDVPGAPLERDWSARVTTYGPSSSHTRLLPRDRLIFVRWGTSPGTRYRGQGPLSWASLTARLAAESERSLADEAGGPLAQLIAVPADGGDGGEDDPLAGLKADIGKARGKAAFVETTAAGWDAGRSGAPHRDWQAARLGPSPPDAMIELARDAYARTLTACGMPPALFMGEAGTAMRDATRNWMIQTVLPLARILERELSDQLEARVRFRFDNYPLDLAGRASAFKALVGGGVAVNEALITAGLLASDE